MLTPSILDPSLRAIINQYQKFKIFSTFQSTFQYILQVVRLKRLQKTIQSPRRSFDKSTSTRGLNRPIHRSISLDGRGEEGVVKFSTIERIPRVRPRGWQRPIDIGGGGDTLLGFARAARNICWPALEPYPAHIYNRRSVMRTTPRRDISPLPGLISIISAILRPRFCRIGGPLNRR